MGIMHYSPDKNQNQNVETMDVQRSEYEQATMELIQADAAETPSEIGKGIGS